MYKVWCEEGVKDVLKVFRISVEEEALVGVLDEEVALGISAVKEDSSVVDLTAKEERVSACHAFIKALQPGELGQ